MNAMAHYNRIIFTLFGTMLSALAPTLPYVLLCTVAVFADFVSAYRLDRRVKKKYPNKAGKDAGKFKSHHFTSVLVTLALTYALLIFSYFLHVYVTDGMPFNALKMSALGIIFWQAWSILENESSCNGARWAKMLQHIMVDKTARHFDIDLTDLEKLKKSRTRKKDVDAED